MSLQARMSESDRRLYNPSRDVAHNFKEVLQLVAARLEDSKWPELAELLAREQVSMDDLGEACAAYCIYVASAVEDPNKSMFAGIADSGFFKCKPAAQVAVMAMIGVSYAGIQHAGIREATIAGEGPLQTVSQLVDSADNLRKYLNRPMWQRKLLRWIEKVKKVINAAKT